ncbi:MAG: hypothetical protein ACP5KJ_03075 [Candidatus Micrarchaeia archaeon]
MNKYHMVASKEMLARMNERAVEFLRKKSVSSDIIAHNQHLFCELAVSINGGMLDARESAKKGAIDLLLLALYHENLGSCKQFPDEVKARISDLFEQFIDLKKRDISPKDTWTFYSEIPKNNLPLLLFRILDLAHIPCNKEFLTKIGFDERRYEEQLNNLAKTILYTYTPYADILGLGSAVNRLRNISASVLYPETYTHVKTVIGSERGNLEKIRNKFDLVLRELVNEAVILNGISICPVYNNERVISRIKSPGSITFKLVSYGMNAEDVKTLHDIVAFTILPATVKDIYMFYSLLKDKLGDSILSVDDYIINPKPTTGYQSLHIDVLVDGYSVELQLKTPEMYQRCDKGDWAHVFIKPSKISKDAFKYMASYSGILYNASTEHIESVLNSMRSNRLIKLCVDVNGHKKHVELPKDARIFDLVCMVSNPKLGNTIRSAQTNRNYSYFDKVPENEVLLEITTNNERMISYQRLRDLLHVCTTKEAHDFIRTALRKMKCNKK